MSHRRYLIVKLGALGDVAMASTLVGAIKATDPAGHLTWVCGRGTADLVHLFEGVDDVVAVDERRLLRGTLPARVLGVLALWRSLLGRRFDVTLLGHADDRYRWLLLAVRTGRVRALEHRVSASMLPIPGRYFGDEYVRMLDAEESRGPIVGHPPLADVRPRLLEPDRPDAIGVVLAPGGARNVMRESALKRWPVERYRDVATALLASGQQVTLVGDAADAWVRPWFAGLAVRDEIGAHDVAGTLSLLAHGDLVVSQDTGILHLARLVRAPVLALFGPTNPAQFLAPGPDVAVQWGGVALACRPCYNGRDFASCSNNLCMQDIAVSDVLRTVAGLRAAGRHSPSSVPQEPASSTS